jgi:Micrococcal nuclease (thermonuclease) homologs
MRRTSISGPVSLPLTRLMRSLRSAGVRGSVISFLSLARVAYAVAGGAEISGPAVVVDGDTLTVDGVHVRLWGIDAPEGTQACARADGSAWRCGDDAREALRRLVDHNTPVVCAPVDQDKYGRTVARCAASGLDLGAAMVRAGWALDYRHYSHGAYAGEEAEAKAAGRGVWSGSLTPPWVWRREHKAPH